MANAATGEVMERKRVRTGALRSIALVVMFGAAWLAKAQDAKTPYPSMAPLEQYMIADRNEEIKTGAECCARFHLRRCRSLGPRTTWLRNGHQRQERFRVRRGAILDVPVRRTGILEPQAAGPDLLQSVGCTNHPANHYQADRVGIGWTVQSSDYRWYQGIREERIAGSGTGRNVLHDVEQRLPKRLRRALASAFDVLHPPNQIPRFGVRICLAPRLC